MFLCLFLVHLQLIVPCDVSALPHTTSVFPVCNHIASAQYVLRLNVDIDLNVLSGEVCVPCYYICLQCPAPGKSGLRTE